MFHHSQFCDSISLSSIAAQLANASRSLCLSDLNDCLRVLFQDPWDAVVTLASRCTCSQLAQPPAGLKVQRSLQAGLRAWPTGTELNVPTLKPNSSHACKCCSSAFGFVIHNSSSVVAMTQTLSFDAGLVLYRGLGRWIQEREMRH